MSALCTRLTKLEAAITPKGRWFTVPVPLR